MGIDNETKIGDKKSLHDMLIPPISYGKNPTKFGSKFEDTSVNPFDIADEWEVLADEEFEVKSLPTFDSRFNFTEIKGSKRNENDFVISTCKLKIPDLNTQKIPSLYKLSKISSTMKKTMKWSVAKSDNSLMLNVSKLKFI